MATPAALATGGTAQRAREALDGPVGADASFAPAPGIVAFQGAGRLAEVPEGVQIAVAVRQAPPGEPALRLVSDKEACSDFLGIAATGPVRVSQGEKLGTLQVERGGEALVKVTVPNVNLKAGDPRSLLGKSLLLDSVAPQKGAPGTPLACAPITDNPPPARR